VPLKLVPQVDLLPHTQVDPLAPLLAIKQGHQVQVIKQQVQQALLLAIKQDHPALPRVIKELQIFLLDLVRTLILDILALQVGTQVTKDQVLAVQATQHLEQLLRNLDILDILSNHLPPTNHLLLKQVMQVMDRIPTVGVVLLKANHTLGHLSK